MGFATFRDVWPGTPPPAPFVPEPEKPLQPSPPLCPATGKIRYARQSEARQHRRDLEQSSHYTEQALAVYVCRECYSWHVGRV